LLVLLGLAARFAALRRRITALAEEILILRCKREGLPTIAALELLIFSHISLSFRPSGVCCVSGFASVVHDRGRLTRYKFG
jgi:hypothetical protein